MSHLPFHPAPGLSDLAPGWFVLPQNPLTMGDPTVLVPTMGATAPGKWIRQPTLADLVQGSFVVPQNPVVQNLAAGLAGMRGMGCGCGGGCGMGAYENIGLDVGPRWTDATLPQNPPHGYFDVGPWDYKGLSGLGATPATDAFSQWLTANGGTPGAWLADQTTLMGFTMPMWGWLAGGAAVAYVLMDLGQKGHAGSKRLAARYAQNPRRRNVAQGYYDGTGFHPIRSSFDYDPDRVDESYQYKPKAKKRRARR